MARQELSDSLDDIIRQACAGSLEPLYRHFIRRGGLPGTRPNYALAKDAASRLLQSGPAGKNVLIALSKLGHGEAASDTAHEFFVVTGVVGQGIAIARGKENLAKSKDLLALQGFAEDRRKWVRDSVHIALGEVIAAHGDLAIEALAPWMDGYLQAESVLRAMTLPETDQSVRSAALLTARLDEAFTLAEKAPRAHERSHGYRALVRALEEVPPSLGKRFSTDLAEWIERRAVTQVPELRDAIQGALGKMRKSGVRAGDLQAAQEALGASKPAPRDPRSYVGPTRKRGKK